MFQNLDHVDSLRLYSQWQLVPRSHLIVCRRSNYAQHMRNLGLARCGHHDFTDGRTARHRDRNAHRITLANAGANKFVDEVTCPCKLYSAKTRQRTQLETFCEALLLLALCGTQLPQVRCDISRIAVVHNRRCFALCMFVVVCADARCIWAVFNIIVPGIDLNAAVVA